MSTSFDSVERELVLAVTRALAEIDHGRVCRVRGDDDAEDERAILERHTWVLGSNARDILGESAERGSLTRASHGALAAHVAGIARELEVADVRRRLRHARKTIVMIDEAGAPLGQLLVETMRPGRPERIRAIDVALEAHAARLLGPLEEARSRADDAERRYSSFTSADVDRAPEGVAERAASVLAETDELAAEMGDFVRSIAGAVPRRPFDLARGLRRAELDDVVRADSRPKRIAAFLRDFGLSAGIERHAAIVGTRAEVGIGTDVVAAERRSIRFLASADATGIAAELSMLDAMGRALAIVGASAGAEPHVQRPRRAYTGRLVGSILRRAAFDVRKLAASRMTPDSILERTRRVAATLTLLELRTSAARVLVARGADPSETLARATGVEWTSPLATLVCRSSNADVRFDAARAGLACTSALRERYDEDFLRHPVASAWITSVLSRASLESPDIFLAEAGASAFVAPELRAFFEGRLP